MSIQNPTPWCRSKIFSCHFADPGANPKRARRFRIPGKDPTRKALADFHEAVCRQLWPNTSWMGERGRQLATSAPVLLFAIAHPDCRPRWMPAAEAEALKRQLAVGVVTGESLKKLHALAGIPYAYRRLPARVARVILNAPDLIPSGLFSNVYPFGLSPREQVHWITAAKSMRYQVRERTKLIADQYWRWVLLADAKHRGGGDYLLRDRALELADILDWAVAGHLVQENLQRARHLDRAITRWWSPKMSVDTALRETRAWHGQLAAIQRNWHDSMTRVDPSNVRELVSPFYQWVFPITLPSGWSIRVITTENELAAEGEAMRHCVWTYAARVRNGWAQIATLRDPKGERALTVEFARERSRLRVVQARGKFNRPPTPEEQQQLDWLLKHRGYSF